MDSAQITQIAVALISVIIGVANCFAGYRLFRILLSLWGFIAGAVVGASIVAQADTVVILLVALFAGLIGVGLVNLLYVVGVFLMGALLGLSLVGGIFTVAGGEPTVYVLLGLIAAVIGGLLAVWLQRPLIILATAVTGAFSVVIGVLLLLTPTADLTTVDSAQLVEQLDQTTRFVIFAGWGLLAILGLMVQFRNAPRQRRRR